MLYQILQLSLNESGVDYFRLVQLFSCDFDDDVMLYLQKTWYLGIDTGKRVGLIVVIFSSGSPPVFLR